MRHTDVIVAEAVLIDYILRRKRAARHGEHEVDLRRLLQDILLWANEFVPSESGSILLDDPVLKMNNSRPGRLYFMACFGPVSGKLVGSVLDENTGIAGHVYRTGDPYFCDDVEKDARWFPRFDEETRHRCQSIISVPIRIDRSAVGVLELINRKEASRFDDRDFALLQIFAGYTATLIQNALDARKFEVMSRTDYLTGLLNFQALHQVLLKHVRQALDDGTDLGAIFFDMDHLKAVNDRHGHLAGSQLIVETGEIAREIFGEVPSVAMSRYGGDEFMIVLPAMDLDRSRRLAEAFREGVEGNVFLTASGRAGLPAVNLRGAVTCSIGVASLRGSIRELSDPEAVAEGLIQAADSAMYRAKQAGRNRVVSADP